MVAPANRTAWGWFRRPKPAAIPSPCSITVETTNPTLNGSALADAGISCPWAYPWNNAKAPTNIMPSVGANEVLGPSAGSWTVSGVAHISAYFHASLTSKGSQSVRRRAGCPVFNRSAIQCNVMVVSWDHTTNEVEILPWKRLLSLPCQHRILR